MFDDYDFGGMDDLTSSLSGPDGFDYSQFNTGGAGGDVLGNLGSAYASGDTGMLGALSQMFGGTMDMPAADGAPSFVDAPAVAAVPQSGMAGSLDKLGDGAGKLFSQFSGILDGKDGNLDLTKVLKLSGGLAAAISGIRSSSKQSKAAEQARALQAQLTAKGQWNPLQQQWSNSFFNTPNTPAASRTVGMGARQPSSIIPGRTYAQGGSVLDRLPPHVVNALMSMGQQHLAEGGMPEEAPAGALGLVYGEGNGQDDQIDARLSKGEYVLDADVVSALGDGSNEAGAAILDQWRENIRSHKRAAPEDEIPPEAMDPNEYLPGEA